MKPTIRFTKIIRRTHLFLALFLVPWVLIYALSTLAMHHRKLFSGADHRVDPGYDLVAKNDYAPSFPEVVNSVQAARQILKDLDMEGAFSVRGDLAGGTLVIQRDRPIGSKRITYDVKAGTLQVERQRFGLAYFLEMLHRRRGFQQPFWMNDLWALMVDGVILTIVLWAATGLWMWWEMVRTRKLGSAFLGVGIASFLLFLILL